MPCDTPPRAREEAVRDAGQGRKAASAMQGLASMGRSLAERRRRRKAAGERTASALKSCPCRSGDIRRCTPASISPARGVGGHQARGALGDAEAAEELGLRDGPVGGETGRARLVGERARTARAP